MPRTIRAALPVINDRRLLVIAGYKNAAMRMLMYQNYWGLQRPLFTNSAVRESLTSSPVHVEALARLDFLLESQAAFGLLCGASGSGKTNVLAAFAEQTRRRGTLAVLLPGIGDEVFVIECLATGLGIEIEGTANPSWRRIIDRLGELKLEGLSAVLLIDDFDRSAAPVRTAVELLLSIPESPLTIVGSVRPETVMRIGTPLLEQTALRIELAPWTDEETIEYLHQSVAKAGRAQPAFEPAAARRLFELSGGAPRRVNQLAHLALVVGAGQKLVQVDEATIDAVQEELSLAR
jgi:general secretion pathway protein A